MALVGTEVLQVNGLAANGQLSGQTFQTTTGQIAGLASANPKTFINVGASATAVIGNKYLLNTAAGSVLTLPAATGTGGTIRIIVSATVTSNSHKVLAASSSDSLQGNIVAEDSGTCTGWNAALSSTFHSLQLNGTTTMGYQGDDFELLDVAANVWQVTGQGKATGTAATPFSVATS